MRTPITPSARIRRSTAQSSLTSIATIIIFDTTTFDTDAMAINNHLECKTAGKYLVTAQVRWAVNAEGFRQIAITINNTIMAVDRVESVSQATQSTMQTLTTLVDLAVGDAIDVEVTQTSGVSLNLES